MKTTRPSKEALYDLYMVQRLSPDNIAPLYGVSGRTIRNWMEFYGIPRQGATHLRKGISAIWNIGIKRSPEQVENMRLFSLGRTPPNKGVGNRKFRCEVCGKDITDKPYRRKRTCSKECKNMLSHIFRGESHWNYKGELAGYVQRKRGWSIYREWRRDVLKQADYICAACGKRGGRLTAHHLYTWNDNPDMRFEVSNGICMCWDCHWSFHRATSHHHTTPEMLDEWLLTMNL